jgi:hypothetical protein
MKHTRELLTLAALLAFGWPAAGSQAAERAVRFAPGATATVLKGAIRGDGDATYVLQAIEGQVLQALLTTSNRSCHFNVYESGQ